MEMEKVTVPRDWCHWERVPGATWMMVSELSWRQRGQFTNQDYDFSCKTHQIQILLWPACLWCHEKKGHVGAVRRRRWAASSLASTLAQPASSSVCSSWCLGTVTGELCLLASFYLNMSDSHVNPGWRSNVFEASFAVKGLRAVGLSQEREQDTTASRMEQSTRERSLHSRYEHQCVNPDEWWVQVVSCAHVNSALSPDLILVFSLCCINLPIFRRSVRRSVRWSSRTRQVHQARALANAGL